MFEMLTDYQIWVSLLTLTALEIVLGIDNLIFLSIVSGRLPKPQQQAARRIGLALALLGRLVLLFSLTWIIGLTEPIFTILDFDISWRDVVLIGGGAFLIVKGTMETHHMLEGHEEEHSIGTVTTRFTMLLHLPPMPGHASGQRVKNGLALAGHGVEAVRDAITRTITTLPEQLRQ